jgi:hypothetical protein
VGVGGGVVVVVVLVPELPHPARFSVERVDKNINQNLYPESMAAEAPETQVGCRVRRKRLYPVSETRV